MRPLYLDWNLGLGDSIICNGLVRTLARDGRQLILPSWKHNLPTVRHMFSDLSNVEVIIPLNGDKLVIGGPDMEVLSIGCNNPKFGSIEPWDESFYVFAGVPFDAKWNLFHVPDSGNELQAVAGRAVIHHDHRRGICIDWTRRKFDRAMEYIDPGYGLLLTDWRFVIQHAAEIHMIDSAPMHLAELLPTTGKLFYHKYARSLGNRNYKDATFRKPWEILE